MPVIPLAKGEFSNQIESPASPSAFASYGLSVMSQSPKRRKYENFEETNEHNMKQHKTNLHDAIKDKIIQNTQFNAKKLVNNNSRS